MIWQLELTWLNPRFGTAEDKFLYDQFYQFQMIKIQAPIFVGYCPKIVMEKSALKGEDGKGGFKNDTVEEICSVSDCICPMADGDAVSKRNEYGFYDSEELAKGIVPKAISAYELFGYKLYPFYFNKGKQIQFTIVTKAAGHMSNYKSIGFDVVSKSSSSFFECSPLSCNYACDIFPVNRFCLFNSIEEALKCAKQISAEIADAKMTKRTDGVIEYNGKWEPGPYYVFQVFRKNG